MYEKMSRRQGRYERRVAKRMAKLRQNNESIGSMEDVFAYGTMYKEGRNCCKGVRWKASTQNFELHLFSGTAARRRAILNHSWKAEKYNHFVLAERGKVRPIDAPRIQDRQVHKIVTKKILLPLYMPSMIYNNGASLPGKGFQFSSKRLKEELRQHFRKYGREGQIILLDFKQFFPSVSHAEIYKRHNKIILNGALRRITDDIVASNGSDIGLPLGVEPSQAEMIAFPSALDNYIKCQLSLHGGGHYMDDYYVLVPPEKDAGEILKQLIEKAESLKLTVNRSKTCIKSLKKPFKYCKLKYALTETGRVIVNGCRMSLVRARRKIKKFKEWVVAGVMSYKDLWSSVNGIVAYFKSHNDHGRILKLRRLFYCLFGFSCEEYALFKMMDWSNRENNEICSV